MCALTPCALCSCRGGEEPRDGEGPERGLFLQQPLTPWSEGEPGTPGLPQQGSPSDHGVSPCPAAPETSQRFSASSPRQRSSTSKVQATSSIRINLKNSSLLSSVSCHSCSTGDQGFCKDRVGPEELWAVTQGSG